MDRDSYFLDEPKEPKELEFDLGTFLALIRDALQEEGISPNDEFIVLVPTLSLEFGEHSRPDFLARNFSEIYNCWERLTVDKTGESSCLLLHLVVRRDPEDRFAELLATHSLLDPSAVVNLTKVASQEIRA